MDKLILTRMEFYGYHGVFAEENKLGQRFYVDAELHMPLDKPGRTDNIEDSINYAEAYAVIKEVVEKRTFKLIEALAEQVASSLLETYTSIEEVTVRVIKPHPPFDIHFAGVTVEISRKRAQS
ncbi:dihydroneopterin aldolase [Paenibacillus chitinolyticus]|uniref:dihydroneopterin aldolase n=1 Tax=Paenibacillus chitinolyticus TaxID=79263 RepID=UPI002DBF4FA9|nr:dihydroneopterin aldolase [Paenibacillus chitinolyticus]MEC0247146.1 dihydroneopterin aldolase [Paenibacillus chitinolyticus]